MRFLLIDHLSERKIMFKNMRFVWFICALFLVFMGCGLFEQTDEANKITEEINTLGNKYNQMSGSTTELFNKLLTDNLAKVSDLKDYKNKNSAEFDELVKTLETQKKLAQEMADKYSPVLKLKLSDTFKEYIRTNQQVSEKHAESDKQMLDFIQAFLDTDDVDKVNKLIEDFDKESVKLNKEIEDLKQKAKQIAKDNPTEIEQ